ncbi:hypothetical protein D3C75_1299440 [compost metagenome]
MDLRVDDQEHHLYQSHHKLRIGMLFHLDLAILYSRSEEMLLLLVYFQIQV